MKCKLIGSQGGGYADETSRALYQIPLHKVNILGFLLMNCNNKLGTAPLELVLPPHSTLGQKGGAGSEVDISTVTCALRLEVPENSLSFKCRNKASSKKCQET